MRTSAGVPQPTRVVLGVLGRELVFGSPHEGWIGVVEPGDPGGEHRRGEVLALVVDVAQEATVDVAVGLSGVGGEGDRGAWWAEAGQELGCRVAVAVGLLVAWAVSGARPSRRTRPRS